MLSMTTGIVKLIINFARILVQLELLPEHPSQDQLGGVHSHSRLHGVLAQGQVFLTSNDNDLLSPSTRGQGEGGGGDKVKHLTTGALDDVGHLLSLWLHVRSEVDLVAS